MFLLLRFFISIIQCVIVSFFIQCLPETGIGARYRVSPPATAESCQWPPRSSSCTAHQVDNCNICRKGRFYYLVSFKYPFDLYSPVVSYCIISNLSCLYLYNVIFSFMPSCHLLCVLPIINSIRLKNIRLAYIVKFRCIKN